MDAKHTALVRHVLHTQGQMQIGITVLLWEHRQADGRTDRTNFIPSSTDTGGNYTLPKKPSSERDFFCWKGCNGTVTLRIIQPGESSKITQPERGIQDRCELDQKMQNHGSTWHSKGAWQLLWESVELQTLSTNWSFRNCNLSDGKFYLHMM